jgi:hypothetical protein
MRIACLESRPKRGTRALLAMLVAAVLVAAALLADAQPASANVAETIILRCTHNESLSGFSQSAYNQALKELNADAEEYSPCSSQIRAAQLAAAVDGRGGGSGAGQSAAAPVAIAATPSEQQAITHAEHVSPESIKLDGAVIKPGVVHANIASALSSLPTPLLATLAFLLACLLLVVGGALRNRVRAGRSD